MHTRVRVGRTSEANVPKSKECNTDMTAYPYRNITVEAGHTVRQTGTPVVDSHMVSDKSPMACLRVQMAPPICLFNTKGMWRTNVPAHPPTSSPALHSLLFPPSTLRTPLWLHPRCQGRHSSNCSLAPAITQARQRCLSYFSWRAIVVAGLGNHPPALASSAEAGDVCFLLEMHFF